MGRVEVGNPWVGGQGGAGGGRVKVSSPVGPPPSLGLCGCVYTPGVEAEPKMPALLKAPCGGAWLPNSHPPCGPGWHCQLRAGASGSLRWLTSLVRCPLPCGVRKVPLFVDTGDKTESPRASARGRIHSFISVWATEPSEPGTGAGDRRGVTPQHS